ncbi:hypothetical protein SORBI_3004G143625 [Sorghum bicolor]|uniref:Uncharacterized protein n=1 Tax=Sorghum bicolor TaxID=4558 RepID=A0A1Z5RMG3_SORBI|nr:hypothetical protein SORBI_3004G143625 [Sorghum bicolor]
MSDRELVTWTNLISAFWELVTWTKLISAFLQNGCPLQGLHHFASMLSLGDIPGASVSLQPCWCCGGRVELLPFSET